jgi:hypothetical protein
MNSYGPFSARVGILQRAPDFLDLVVRNRPDVTAYRLWGAPTINDAYGALVGSGLGGTGGTALLDASVNTIAQSPSAQARYRVEECRRGSTSFQLDIEDYVTPVVPPPFGPDDDFLFVRVQERRRTAGWLQVPAGAVNNPNWPIKGPILVVPSATFFGMAGAAITMQGMAPAGTGSPVGRPPVVDETVQDPLPMHLVTPRPITSVSVRNIDPTEDLLISWGLGMPMTLVTAGDSFDIFGIPGITEIVLAALSPGGSIGFAGCAFSIEAQIDLYAE